MSGLTRNCDAEGKWCPLSIASLEALLIKVVKQGRGYRHSSALRKQLAYNLQHLEFLDRCTLDLKLTSVLVTQTWKTFIIVGCGVVESLLHFLLIANDVHKRTEWELVCIAPGQEKQIDGEVRKIDSHIYRKLPFSQLAEMAFDSMLKKAESKRVLGSTHDIYPKLKKLRRLRNKVHLQEVRNDTDTDWNAFQQSDVSMMADVILSVFTSTIFQPSAEQVNYFAYLARHKMT